MNWWPWQSTPLPSRTSANAAAPVGATRDPYLSAPSDDLSLIAAWGLKANARIFQTPEIAVGQAEANIDWYRNRARSAEGESRRLRAALLEIACAPLPPDDGDRSQWKAVIMIAISIAERALDIKSAVNPLAESKK